ncbi:MAG: beta-ketoacyl-[acyl-carrier-protein] synthase II [Chloroflexota bacterium]|nr:MAG: beta-ketoacyl-[acyl-carrier-protein] synthase II [Chloroflexota bacterium]
MNTSRIVVTGIGAITPIGLNVAEFWRNLVAGVSGVGPITAFDASALPVRIAAEVRGFDPSLYLDAKTARRLERFAQFAVAVVTQALADARLIVDEHNAERIGIVMNTGGGGVVKVVDEARVEAERGPDRVSPLFVPMMMPNIGACQASISSGIRGPVMTATAACAAGIQAIVDGWRLLRNGEADVVIAGATECAMTSLAFAGLSNMHALSRRNDDPTRASRPFDRDRDGFVFGEGAGALVLEREDHARARGATPIAVVAGGAMTADAHHITAPRPDGEGAARAMTRAMAVAGIAPKDVDYVCAHATATGVGDVAEVAAIHRAFGPCADHVAVSAPKSMVGHLLGAAGAITAIASILAIRDSIIPPTINYETPDPECALDVVPNVARRAVVRAALANGFGFGGQNAVAVFTAL